MAITKLGNMKAAQGINKAQHLQNGIRYVMDPKKTEGYLVGTNCTAMDAGGIYREMVDVKEAYQKTDGRQGYHFVISFKSGDPNVNKELALTIASEFCEEYLGDRFQYVYAVHTDHDHIHAHIAFNSVSILDGYKYHYANGDWEKIVQPLTNRLCRKYGLEEIDITEAGRQKRRMAGEEQGMPYVEWNARKGKGVSWRLLLRKEIDELLPKVRDLDGLIGSLKADGYEVKKGKYLSVKPPAAERFIRTRSLGDAYTEEALSARCGIRIVKERIRKNPVPRAVKCRWTKYSRPYMSPWMKRQFAYYYRRYQKTPKTNYYLQKMAMKEFNALKRCISLEIRCHINNYTELMGVKEQLHTRMEELTGSRRQLRHRMRPYQGKFEILEAYDSLAAEEKLYQKGHIEFEREHERRLELAALIDVDEVREARRSFMKKSGELNRQIREVRRDLKTADTIAVMSQKMDKGAEEKWKEPDIQMTPEKEKKIP
jgi:hypothetical protein